MLRAAFVAAVVSGAPSTLWAIVHGDDPLAATLAAGRLLRPDITATAPLLGSAALVHTALSLGWSGALAAVIPRGMARRDALGFGAAAGLAIAVLDLGVAHRSTSARMSAIRALPVAPQVADHALFGICVAAVLARDARSCRPAPGFTGTAS